mmetsp:Transcript_12080/g.34536  ORF Transcript_12080/g.34536 Transcript_12080/m.34536 type:complete len:200 (+) Transcript_12080:138-737(+)
MSSCLLFLPSVNVAPPPSSPLLLYFLQPRAPSFRGLLPDTLWPLLSASSSETHSSNTYRCSSRRRTLHVASSCSVRGAAPRTSRGASHSNRLSDPHDPFFFWGLLSLLLFPSKVAPPVSCCTNVLLGSTLPDSSRRYRLFTTISCSAWTHPIWAASSSVRLLVPDRPGPRPRTTRHARRDDVPASLVALASETVAAWTC